MSDQYTVKDSGKRQEFVTGSRRDTDEGKPRYDLLPVPTLTRWAEHMAKGAEKYGDRNWEKGQPLARYEASALRHFMAYMSGETDEDHLAAVLFNVGAIMHHESEIDAGRLPRDLDDRPEIRHISGPMPELGIGVRVQVDGSRYPTWALLPGTISIKATIYPDSWVVEFDDGDRGLFRTGELEAI